MDAFAGILARGDDYGGERLYYIIALLIFVGLSALAEKLKRAMSGSDKEPRQHPPVVPREPGRPAQPPRPATHLPPEHPVSQPRPPQAYPVGREGQARRPVPPVPPTMAAPPPWPQTPAARAAPPRRPPAPPPRRPFPPRQRVATEAPTPPPLRTPVTAPPQPPRGEEPPGLMRLEAELAKTLSPTGTLPRRGTELPTVPTTLMPKPPTAGAMPDLGSFQHLSIAEIRRAIVLNEVLGPPLALRAPQSSWDQ